MSMYPLYIDPGTGSMLFSVMIGLFTTLYFVGRAFIIKFKFVITGKKSDAMSDTHNHVIFCEGSQYISLFLPVLEAFEQKSEEVIYYTTVKDDPAFSANYTYVKPEYIGEGNTAIARLNFLKAKVCLMTTPGLNVYQLKRSKGVKHYSHVVHMVRDATVYRLFGLDYFDSVLLTGDYQKKDIRLLEEKRNIPQKELVTVGCSYLDTLQKGFNEEIKQQEKLDKPFTVLVSPTWGKSGLLSLYGEKLLDPLAQSAFHIIIRPHPQSKKSEPAVLEALELRYKDRPNIEWDYNKDNTLSIARSDIMISDLSGIIFDYVFLRNKPFLYASDEFDLRPYDAYDLTLFDPPVMPWQFEILPKIGKKLEESDFANIENVITSLSDSKELAEGRKKARAEAWMYEGLAGEKTADFMIERAKKF